MTRADFIHATAIRAAASLAAIRGPIYFAGLGEGEAVGLVLSPTECAQRAKAVAIALAEAFDIDHPEGADVLEDEPWRST